MTNIPIKVLIYEDNEPLRFGFSMLIGGTAGFEIVGAFDRCTKVIEQVSALQPDVILMDIEMPEKDGIWGAQMVYQRYPSVEVIMLTVFDDDERVFKALCAGATGYLLKEIAPADLLAAIRDVYEGGAPMSPKIARKVLRAFPRKKGTAIDDLSEREYEVLEYLAKGHSYKMVADVLNIAMDTVRSHIRHIYEKLHVHSVTEAVAKYYEK